MDTRKLLEVNGEGDAKATDFREIIFTYIIYWKWFLLSAIIAVSYTLFDLAKTNNVYNVSSEVLMSGGNNSSSADDIMAETLGLRRSNSNINNEIEVMLSKSVLADVVLDLGLHNLYYVNRGLRTVELYKSSPVVITIDSASVVNLTSSINIEALPLVDKDGYGINIVHKGVSQSVILKDEDIPITIGEVSFKISRDKRRKIVDENLLIKVINPEGVARPLSKQIIPSSYNDGSTIVKLSLNTFNIQKAKDVLDRVVYYYNEQSIREKNRAFVNTGKFIEERIEAISDELKAVEVEISDFKQSYKLTTTEANAANAMQKSQGVEEGIYEFDMQLNLIDYIDKFISDKENKYSIIPTLNIKDNAFNSMITKYNDEILKRSRLLVTSQEVNPSIEKIDQNLITLRAGVMSAIVSAREVVKFEKAKLQSKGDVIDSKLGKAPEIEREMVEIMRQQSIKSELYIFLLQKREENALSQSITLPVARVITSPESSGYPILPQRGKDILVSLAIGLMIPAAIIFLMGLFKITFKDRIDVERLTQIPVIGEISKSTTKEEFVVKPKSTEPIVELFRLLRNNTQTLLDSPERKVVLVTSTSSKEGKSFVSANTALSFAMAKKKTILVGLDVRNPRLRKTFSISSSKGLVNYLTGKESDLSQLIVSSGVSEHLDLLPTGPIPPNPNELLMNNLLDDIFDKLREQYDYIIVDTAPIGLVSDTYLLAKYTDAVLYVMRASYSSKRYIAVLEDAVKEDKLRNVNIVVNDVNIRSRIYGYKRYGYGYGYGYGSSYGYGYGYGYGTENLKSQTSKTKKPFWRRWV